MACTWALKNLQEESHIMILSDSQAASMVINSTNTHSRMVLDITNSIHWVPNKLEIRWVPSHTGAPWNEHVDELARTGLASRPIGPEPFLPISNRAIQKRLLNYLHSLHLSQDGTLAISSKGKIHLTIHLPKQFTPIPVQ